MRRLPDGEETDNITKYLDEWEKVYSPLELVLDARVIGYDPGLLFQLADGRTFDLPSDVAYRLYLFIQDHKSLMWSK